MEVVDGGCPEVARIGAAATVGILSLESGCTEQQVGRVYGRAAGAPSVQLSIGATEPRLFEATKAKGTNAPGTHTPKFAPDRERTIRTGVAVFTLSVLELLVKRVEL